MATKGHNEREVAEKIKNKWDLNIDEESECLAPMAGVAPRQFRCWAGHG